MNKLIAITTLAILSAWAHDCYGQYRGRNRTATEYILNRPTVSPYLNLTRNVGSVQTSTNYHSLVRPQIEARRRANQQQQSIRRVQSQLSNLNSERASSTRQQVQQQQRGAVTGHPTGRNYFMHFYPGLQRR